MSYKQLMKKLAKLQDEAMETQEVIEEKIEEMEEKESDKGYLTDKQEEKLETLRDQSLALEDLINLDSEVY